MALGLAAPLSHDVVARVGRAWIGPLAMGVCLGAVGLLVASVNLAPHHYTLHTVALLVLGLGLGLFIAPNNTATLAATEPDLAGAAGSLLNLMRVLGTSLGVAVGATMVTWRLELVTGSRRHWFEADTLALLDAARSSMPGGGPRGGRRALRPVGGAAA